MNIEYNWGKEDLKKELKDSRNKANFKFLIFGILAFLYFTYYAIKSDACDNKVILMYAVIYLFILCLILVVTTKIYVLFSLRKNDKKTNKAYGTYKIKLDEKFITVSINNQVIKYNYSDIYKFKIRKRYFFINTKEDKIGLTFKKNVIGKEEYDKMLEYIKGRTSK